jgi:hypothetical protein
VGINGKWGTKIKALLRLQLYDPASIGAASEESDGKAVHEYVNIYHICIYYCMCVEE